VRKVTYEGSVDVRHVPRHGVMLRKRLPRLLLTQPVGNVLVGGRPGG